MTQDFALQAGRSYRLTAPAHSGAVRAYAGAAVEVEATNGDGSVATVAWVTVCGWRVHFSAIPAELLAPLA